MSYYPEFRSLDSRKPFALSHSKGWTVEALKRDAYFGHKPQGRHRA